MPSNRPRTQGNTKSSFERQRARDAYQRRQARRQQAAAHEGGVSSVEMDDNRMRGLEGQTSDAGHVSTTDDRDQAATQVQQPSRAYGDMVLVIIPPREATGLAQDLSKLAIADPAVEQRDAQCEQSQAEPESSADTVGDDALGDQGTTDQADSMETS
ncbi:hypothetical protein H9Q74_000018 [Fusarium xylarioides]|nr:hypothetical protein H9Q71_000166 [Fusarium xylarioides]KAG5829865.1 hypothetical protein H9Q74_000018 [Fusarium xylarioides]